MSIMMPGSPRNSKAWVRVWLKVVLHTISSRSASRASPQCNSVSGFVVMALQNLGCPVPVVPNW